MKSTIQSIKQRLNKLRLLFLGLGLYLASTLFFYTIYSPKNIQPSIFQSTPTVLSAQIEQRQLPQAPQDLTTLNILLLGFGGPGHQGGYLTDVIQLAHFDFEKNLLSLISIPRDLWVTLPSGKGGKINEAFLADANSQSKDNISSAPTIKSMASIVTGLPIDYFIAIDFVGFQRAVGNELGGIEVEVTQTLDDPWYPTRGLELEPCGYTPQEITDLTAQYSGFELEKQFPCRYEHVYFEPGAIRMEGGDALSFVRSRHSSSDFDRSTRQQAVLLAMKDKLFSLKALDNTLKFFNQMISHVHTDIDKDIINYLSPALTSVNQFRIVNLNLNTDNVLNSSTSQNGAFILVPKASNNNWQEIHKYISIKL